MNVADKDAMFNEAFRVLKPGGFYTFSHLAEGANAPPIYPLPWALFPDMSFLETPEFIFTALSAFSQDNKSLKFIYKEIHEELFEDGRHIRTITSFVCDENNEFAKRELDFRLTEHGAIFTKPKHFTTPK